MDMEPFDIDNIIKHKLGENNTLHLDSLESAKPFVWEGIQHRLSGKQYTKLYYLAAAVILLALSFSFVFYSLERSHDQEITYLQSQLDQMQREYQEQNMKLSTKNVQLISLEQQLSEIKQQLSTIQKSSTKQPPYQVKMVTRTDTVYVPQVKYITLKPDLVDTKVFKDTVAEPARLDKMDTLKNLKTDDAIFITLSTKPAEQSPETIKVKFGPFTRGN